MTNSNDRPSPAEKKPIRTEDVDVKVRKLNKRINRRFARHMDDELMLSLKTISRRILLARLKAER